MRSSWKYFTLESTVLEKQYGMLLGKPQPKQLVLKNRKLSVTNFFINSLCKIHQGKFSVRFRLNEFYLGYKLGQFTKTRKPFFFRSKKKKK